MEPCQKIAYMYLRQSTLVYDGRDVDCVNIVVDDGDKTVDKVAGVDTCNVAFD